MTNSSLYSTLALPWKVAIEQAWMACRQGNLPIGSVLTDKHGNIVARGHNLRFSKHANHPFAGSPIAHAEIVMLGSIKCVQPLSDFSLYSTLEPCFMCSGAIRMAGIGHVHFASTDPGFGGMKLFESDHFKGKGNFEITGPTSIPLEELLIALLVERLIKFTGGKMHQALDFWSATSPKSVSFGKWLAHRGIIEKMRQKNITSENLINNLEIIYRDYIMNQEPKI